MVQYHVFQADDAYNEPMVVRFESLFGLHYHSAVVLFKLNSHSLAHEARAA